MTEQENIQVLSKLENFRLKLRNGEIQDGSADWVVRMCQAHIAEEHYTNRNQWTSSEEVQDIYKNYSLL